MAFIDKLMEALENKNISQYKLCNELNIGQSTISSWKKGKMPTAEKIVAIVRYLEVSADWILEIDSKDPIDLTSEEKELLEYFRKLPDREQIRELGRMEARAEQYSSQPGKSSSCKTD